jgi:glutamate dehydrogenase (NAD(P)+)
VTVVPDFVANAGGVVAAAYAMDARYSAFPPEREKIFETISAKLRMNTTLVLDEADRRSTTPHRAGRLLAQNRVREAMRLKGRLPRH